MAALSMSTVSPVRSSKLSTARFSVGRSIGLTGVNRADLNATLLTSGVRLPGAWEGAKLPAPGGTPPPPGRERARRDQPQHVPSPAVADPAEPLLQGLAGAGVLF